LTAAYGKSHIASDIVGIVRLIEFSLLVEWVGDAPGGSVGVLTFNFQLEAHVEHITHHKVMHILLHPSSIVLFSLHAKQNTLIYLHDDSPLYFVATCSESTMARRQ
jgi:hypothetical protein